MSGGVELWNVYVAAAVVDAELLAEAEGGTPAPAVAAACGHVAFRLGLSSLLVGAEDVGRLALACERVLDRIAAGALGDDASAPLSAGLATLRAAIDQLAHPDKSGARVEGLPIAERRAALDALAATTPEPGAPPFDVAPRAPLRASGDDQPAPEAAEPAQPGGFVWVPTVDDDMIELFFDEATDRVEALAGKLVEIERRPGDAELVREVFRDLHTVKGSSAMVGLAPVNTLAHAAEDLVGQIRDAGRTCDGPVTDALLAALDALRAMLAQARARQPLTVEPAPVVARLRNPAAAPLRHLEHLGEELSRIERVLGDVTWELDHGADRLEAISAELREQVMRLRMVPVGGVFRKHVRTVRDLAASLGKRARLELAGDDTELDKLLVEALDEPLMHLVRNAVDHGLEDPAGRAAAGKPAEGVVRLSASHRGNQVEIRVADDGKGMVAERLRAKAVEKGVITAAEAEALDDRGALDLIFRAGFSTAATISHVSGRGVGMDVVRATVVTKLKGTIDVESTPGQGSVFVLRLPLTLAIIQVLLARAGGEIFAIPLDTVLRVLVVAPGDVRLVGDREVVEVRGRHVPLIRLESVLELDDHGDPEQLHIVLTEQGGVTYGLVCDHLLGKKEIVIKSLGPLLGAVPCVAGATLLGERCALILDIPAIVRRALARPAGRAPGDRGGRARPGTAASSQILLVEDSDIIRESLRRLLVDAGYHVTVAVDGQHGLELAQGRQFDLVSTDVNMPRLDGYELTRTLREMPGYADVPIVMVTSRGERIDRVRGFDAGVDEYITKPHDRQLLLRAVRKLLGHGGGGDDGDDGATGAER